MRYNVVILLTEIIIFYSENGIMAAITALKTNVGQQILAAVQTNPRLAESTRHKYGLVVQRASETGIDFTDAAALARYAAGLSLTARSHLRAAVKSWAEQVEEQVKTGATPDNIAAVQATIYRTEALKSAIKVPVRKGRKAHIWLSQAQVQHLLRLPDTGTLGGKRDKVLLGLLVGAGLRREELSILAFADVTVQPVGDTPRTVLSVAGKGAKDRIVPLSPALAQTLALWRQELSDEGRVVRSVSKGGWLGDSLSATGIFHVVREYGAALGLPKLQPHDLRRTFAHLAYDSGTPLTQISVLLGHASLATTQRYLNLELDLRQTASDAIPMDAGW